MKNLWSSVLALLVLAIRGSASVRSPFPTLSSSYPLPVSSSSSFLSTLSSVSSTSIANAAITTSTATVLQSTPNHSLAYSLPKTLAPQVFETRHTSPINVSSSFSDQSSLRLPLYLRCTATTICVILLVIGCAGNMLVPFVVLMTKDLRNSTNIFLINLSISDILVLIISAPTVLIELHSQPEVWFLGSFVCKAVSFVEIAVAHSSILTILAISFERFYAICRPLHAGYKCTKRRAIIIIAINWTIAISSTLPMLSITEIATAEFIDGSLVPVCSNTLQVGWHPIYYFVIFVTFFLFPFLVLLAIYLLIARRLTSDSKTLASSTNHFKRQAQVRRQVVLMLASVCITFFVCLLPFRLMTLWIIFSSAEDIQNLGMETYYCLLYTCRILLYVNSSANPILYNLISSKFRTAFCRVLKINPGLIFRRAYDHSVLSDKTSTTFVKASLTHNSRKGQLQDHPLTQKQGNGEADELLAKNNDKQKDERAPFEGIVDVHSL